MIWPQIRASVEEANTRMFEKNVPLILLPQIRASVEEANTAARELRARVILSAANTRLRGGGEHQTRRDEISRALSPQIRASVEEANTLASPEVTPGPACRKYAPPWRRRTPQPKSDAYGKYLGRKYAPPWRRRTRVPGAGRPTTWRRSRKYAPPWRRRTPAAAAGFAGDAFVPQIRASVEEANTPIAGRHERFPALAAANTRLRGGGEHGLTAG